MSDYIKREDAYKYIDEHLGEVFTGQTIAEAIKEILLKASTADVVEVVRCKNCIFNNDGWCGADHYGGRWIEADDYCSFGEERGR